MQKNTENQSYSLGCELTPSLYALLTKNQNLDFVDHIDHLQLSIPSLIEPNDVINFFNSVDVDCVLHSNSLNTMGKNNWPDLVDLAKKIENINPVHIIEHFTLYRDTGTKTAVWFSPKAFNLELTIANINKWQSMTNAKVFLENVPITTNASDYLKALALVRCETGVSLVIDIPHLLISSIAIDPLSPLTVFHKYLQILEPKHIHISSLSGRNNCYQDNHHNLDISLLNLALSTLDRVEYVTFEQSDIVSIEKLKSTISSAKTNLKNSKFTVPIGGRVLTNNETNESLAYGMIKRQYPGIQPSTSKTSDTASDYPRSIRIFNELTPFVWPLDTLKLHLEGLHMKEAIGHLSILARQVLPFSNWCCDTRFVSITLSSDSLFNSSTETNAIDIHTDGKYSFNTFLSTDGREHTRFKCRDGNIILTLNQ